LLQPLRICLPIESLPLTLAALTEAQLSQRLMENSFSSRRQLYSARAGTVYCIRKQPAASLYSFSRRRRHDLTWTAQPHYNSAGRFIVHGCCATSEQTVAFLCPACTKATHRFCF